jgi:hypothetical protein
MFMKNVSRKAKLGLVLGALVVLTLAIGVIASAEVVDPPTGFIPNHIQLAGIVDPPTGSPIKG